MSSKKKQRIKEVRVQKMSIRKEKKEAAKENVWKSALSETERGINKKERR